jgi:putative effector of murein hydrolase LrgA (UPF0299 family)
MTDAISGSRATIALVIAGAAVFIRYITEILHVPLPETIAIALSVVALFALLAAVFLFISREQA